MTRHVRALLWLGYAAVAGLAPVAHAGVITQTASLPLTSTDFSPGSPALAGQNPLVIQPFDSQGGARLLDSVTLNFSASVRNSFEMRFMTPATITTSVASGVSNDPGPKITLYQPDGKTPLVTAQASNDPATLSKSVTYGGSDGQLLPQSFSSQYATSSPYYLAPSVAQASSSLKLTSPADLALFSGTQPVALPVVASAHSSFNSSSGNGSGKVTTQGTAQVTVSYNWHEHEPAPQTVPEPSTVLIFGLGGLALYAGKRRRA